MYISQHGLALFNLNFSITTQVCTLVIDYVPNLLLLPTTLLDAKDNQAAPTHPVKATAMIAQILTEPSQMRTSCQGPTTAFQRLSPEGQLPVRLRKLRSTMTAQSALSERPTNLSLCLVCTRSAMNVFISGCALTRDALFANAKPKK